jgi:hypothetical protein
VAQAQEASRWDRGNFTLLLNLGVGFQRDPLVDQTERGLAGINLGIGGFLADDLALMFRWSGTAGVDQGPYEQTSAAYAPTIQYWVDDRLSLEAGAGLGLRSVDNTDIIESGLGLMLGAGYTLFGGGKHAFRLGIEYAAAFTEPTWVHNVGFVLGWQLL